MGPLVMYLILMKWLWNLHVEKLEKSTVGMGVCKIVEQMEKIDPKNWAKLQLLKNGWHWHQIEGITDIPFVTPPNLDANVTSFECYELLFHTLTSHYTKMVRAKMFHKSIPKLNSQSLSN
jgi:hypothetical protein